MSHTSFVMDAAIASDLERRPPILFHSLVVTERERHRVQAGATALASACLHGALVAAALVLPLLFYDAIPKQEALRAFFVTPLEIQPAPPPPPPPPPGARPVARSAPKPTQTPASGFVAPIEIPSEIRLDEQLDLGVSGGVAGGVEGGVPGGVVGGIVGGLPDSEAPPPPEVAPIRVGGHIRRPVKIRDVLPRYPQLAADARVEGTVILECVISPRGTVSDVKALRGSPLLIEAAVEAVRQWVYTPTLLNGIPVPVVMTVTVQFDLTPPR